MKKIAIVAALAMSGLIYKTADAQIGVSLGLHFGSHRNDAPVARIAVQAPVYERNTISGYYADNDERYDRDRNAYRGREERYDNRGWRGQMEERYNEHYDRRGGDLDRGGYRNDQRYQQNNRPDNREQNSNHGDYRNNNGGQQHSANGYNPQGGGRVW